MSPDVILSVGSALIAALSSLGGSSSRNGAAAEKFSRGWYAKLGLCIVAWFASSAICSFGTKRSLNSLAPHSCAGGLTTLQFIIAAAVGGATYLATGERMVPGIMPDVFRVAMAYTFGFLFFNMSYDRLAASFAETVRGMEPLFAFTLARLLGARGGTLSSTSVTALVCLLLGGAVSCYAQQFDAVRACSAPLARLPTRLSTRLPTCLPTRLPFPTRASATATATASFSLRWGSCSGSRRTRASRGEASSSASCRTRCGDGPCRSRPTRATRAPASIAARARRRWRWRRRGQSYQRPACSSTNTRLGCC